MAMYAVKIMKYLLFCASLVRNDILPAMRSFQYHFSILKDNLLIFLALRRKHKM